MSAWSERVRWAEEQAGVYDCDECGNVTCSCAVDEDAIYEEWAGK